MPKKTAISVKTAEDFLIALGNIGVFKAKDGKRAVHKPLLILLALAKVQRSDRRLMRFTDIEDELSKLLIQFGTTSHSNGPKAQYPFWYLKSDGFWEVPFLDSLQTRGGKKEPALNALRTSSEGAGFTQLVWNLLRKQPNLIAQAADIILKKTFPETLREDILSAVGLDVPILIQRTKRDGRFREEVLRAYSYACAVCGFDGRVDGRVVGVEAAHIRWVEAGGPNTVDNGLALCSLHHKLFDMGAFGISPEKLEIQVSTKLSGRSHQIAELHELNGSMPTIGARKDSKPNSNFLKWHLTEVYRK